MQDAMYNCTRWRCHEANTVRRTAPFSRLPHICWWNTLSKTSFSPQHSFAYICVAAFSGVPISWRVLSYTWVDRVSQLSRESREGRESDLQLAWDWQPRNVQLYMCGSLGRRTDSGWISQLQLCQTYPVWRENSQILCITNSEKKKRLHYQEVWLTSGGDVFHKCEIASPFWWPASGKIPSFLDKELIRIWSQERSW